MGDERVWEDGVEGDGEGRRKTRGVGEEGVKGNGSSSPLILLAALPSSSEPPLLPLPPPPFFLPFLLLLTEKGRRGEKS